MKQPILGICFFYLILASSYAIAVPLWEAPDEPAHFIYADHFARYGQPQPRTTWLPGGWLQNVITGYEWHQPPVYYALGGMVLRINRILNFLPPFSNFPTIIATPERVFAPTLPLITEPHLLRFLSILFGLGTILLVFFLIRGIFPDDRWLPELAAGFIAFIPQFLFLHSYVTNDTLAICCATLSLFFLINTVAFQKSINWRRWVATGLVSAPAIAVKMTAWFLLPLALLSILIYGMQTHRSLRNTTFLSILYYICALSLLLISWLLWPDLFNRLLASPTYTGIRWDFFTVAHLIDLITLTHSSFWGHFGWMNLPITPPLFIALDTVGLIGLCMGVYTCIRHIHSFPSNQRNAILILWFAIVFVLMTFVFFNMTTFQPQGRFFYSAITAIAFFVAYGWMTLAGKHRKTVALTILSMMVLINILVLTTVILPAYAPPLG